MGWFSADMQTMRDLFLHTMQDIYYAEHQIEKAPSGYGLESVRCRTQKGVPDPSQADEGADQTAQPSVQETEGQAARDQMPGDRRHYRRGERDRGRGRRQDGAQCGADRGGTSRRALRNHALRNPGGLGQAPGT